MVTLEQLNQLAENYGMIVVVVAIIVAVIVMVCKAWPGISQAVHFVDVMVAVPAKFDQIDRRLAAIEPRTATIETKVATIQTKVHAIEHEIKPNSGKSMKDQANRNEQNVDKIKHALGIPES